jgi:hypothetical protein
MSIFYILWPAYKNLCLSQLPSAEKKKINQQSKMIVNQTLQENRIVENHLLPQTCEEKNGHGMHNVIQGEPSNMHRSRD